MVDAMKEIDFRLLLEQLPAIVWATDRELRFLSSRGAGLAALGLGAEEVVGLPLRDHLGPRAPDDPTLAVPRAALTGVARCTSCATRAVSTRSTSSRGGP